MRTRTIPEIPVKVTDGEKSYSIMVKNQESILDALVAGDSTIAAVCGGTGRCGKCKIKVLHGDLPASVADMAYFTEKEVKEGMRLACKAYPTEPLQIALQFKGESSFVVWSEFRQEERTVADEEQRGKISEEPARFGIAIDIGTTTIAMHLIDCLTGNKMAAHTTVNHQRIYGADVISRITASVQGKKEELQNLIRKDLAEGIRSVIEKSGVQPQTVNEIVIAGNTTMIHLLMGYPCKGLGEFPFTPVNIRPITDSYAHIIGDDFVEATVSILPGISAFVGGDIVAGLYACGVDTKKEYSLLIDLGTNGEIALGNRDKIMVTSTAAGPAFEGGNITFGVGSIEGAISGVVIEEDGPHIRTIADQAPVGICGTGVIEAVSELLKAGLVDETGLLKDMYFDEGYLLTETENGTGITLTQADIREIQMAKAAVCAGVEILFRRYGITKEEVSHVYLAGGFGFTLDCGKAIQIGMLPEGLGDKIESVGNSALGGAVKFLMAGEDRNRITTIVSSAQEVNLSADEEFYQVYMDAMYLRKCIKFNNK